MLFRKRINDGLIDLNAKTVPIRTWKVEKPFLYSLNWLLRKYSFRYFKFKADNVSCFVSEQQEQGLSVEGIYLAKRLHFRFLLNAAVLDYLLKHPEEIPKDWFGYAIVFLGTIYINSEGKRFARCLYNTGHEWSEDYLCVEGICRFTYKHKIPYVKFFPMLKSIHL
jgi:hypothetical protein